MIDVIWLSLNCSNMFYSYRHNYNKPFQISGVFCDLHWGDRFFSVFDKIRWLSHKRICKILEELRSSRRPDEEWIGHDRAYVANSILHTGTEIVPTEFRGTQFSFPVFYN